MSISTLLYPQNTATHQVTRIDLYPHYLCILHLQKHGVSCLAHDSYR